MERSTDEDVLALIDEELDYITYVLEEDAKNYHVSSFQMEMALGILNHSSDIVLPYSVHDISHRHGRTASGF